MELPRGVLRFNSIIFYHRQPKYPGSALIRLLPTLEQELHVQSLDSASRALCCDFFTEIIARHAAWIVQAGDQFTSLIISAFDGETDPRVLMKHFQLIALLQSKLFPGQSQHLWDEILDVIACYFPVEFDPDEKDKITRADLSSSLNQALVAGLKSGSPMAKKRHSGTLIELIIEKIHSDSAQVFLVKPFIF